MEGMRLQSGRGRDHDRTGMMERETRKKARVRNKREPRALRMPRALRGTRADRAYRTYLLMENNDKVALSTAVSTVIGGAMAIVKLAMGLWTMSVLFIVSAVYYAMLCVSRFSIVKSHTSTRLITDRVQRLRREMSVYHRTGGLLCFIGLSYAAFSLTMYYTGSPHQYGEIVAITVATITFTKIGIAIRGMVISRRTRNPIDASVKFVTFIDAMLSLVVTQDVLLEAEGASHAAQVSGLFGIGLGGVTVVICLFMLLRRRWTDVNERSDEDARPVVDTRPGVGRPAELESSGR